MTAFIDWFRQAIGAINDLVRPFLTFFITTLYNVILAWACFSERITVDQYMAQVGAVNAMIVGFWFGEKKTAVQDAGTKRKGGE